MTSNFTINRVFDEFLTANFTIDDGVFNNNGDNFILAVPSILKNIDELDSFEDVVYNEDADNYFIKELSTSLDNITWTVWEPLDFNNFVKPANNFYIRFRYTFNSNITIPNPIELKEFNFYGTRIIDEIFNPSNIPGNGYKIYTNTDTYKVFKIEDIELFSSDNTNLKIYIRYTQTQGRHWSKWVEAIPENLLDLQISKVKFCDFQFAFQNTSSGDISLYDLELIGEFQNVTANYNTTARLGLKTQCNPLLTNQQPSCSTDANGNDINLLGNDTNLTCIPCSQAETPWNKSLATCSDGCDTTNYVNLNDKNLWEPQFKMLKQLNEYIVGTNSWKITYLLTNPDVKGIDYVLNEQQIHNVIRMRDINIVVPNNKFMTDSINFSGLDLDLIQSFEIHILKDQFKDVFGVEFRPSTRDVIYFCNLNQLWEIDKMFPQRSFMHAEVYYRVLLKKYNDRASRQFADTQDGQDAKALIDALTDNTTLDDMFGDDIDNEINKIVKDDIPIREISSNNSTPLTDMNIRTLDNSVEIIKHELYNASVVVSDSTYKMEMKSLNKKLVKYNHKDNTLQKGEDRAISFWFNTEDYDPSYDWDLVNNYDSINNEGYKISLNSNVLTFQINTGLFTINAPLAANTWYCILANLDQTKEQVELAIYKRQSENGIVLNSSKLILVNKMKYNINMFEFDFDNTIYLGGVDIHSINNNTKSFYITNFRLWNEPIPTKKRSVILNEKLVFDSQLTLIVDNAKPDFKLPKFGNY